MKQVLNEQCGIMQRIELEMLKELKPILERNDIPFTLAYGSALGCYRHHGYIPWDDDTDIYIPSEYLPKLLQVFAAGFLRISWKCRSRTP